MIHPSMYYEVEEFINLIKAGKLESAMNSYENSIITAKIWMKQENKWV